MLPELADSNRRSSATKVLLEGAKAPRRSPWRRLAWHKSGLIGGTIIVVLVLSATLGPLFVSNPNKQNLDRTLEQPGRNNLLGTDQLGRDLLSRLLSGGRLSLIIGLIVVGISGSIGSMLGVMLGYFKGHADTIIMRFVDILMAFPSLLLALLVVATLGTGLVQTMVAVGIAQIPRFVRLARASALAVTERDFVVAARALGQSDLRIVRVHVFPNCVAPLIVEGTILIGTSILIAASLSFLGLGVHPPTAEWGNMLSDGRDYLRVAPHIVVFPGLCILFTVLGFNLLGDGLRDSMDVKIKV